MAHLLLLATAVHALSIPSTHTMFSALPALPRNFADPAIITVNSSFYAFATDDQVVSNNLITNHGVNVQLAHSADFSNWTYFNQDILPDAGPWTTYPSKVWAPDVVQLDNGQFVLYYAAQPSAHKGVHCIGAATANNVIGPYTATSEPLACPFAEGGAIDPSGFKDPATGKRYVMWKVDGNNGQPGGKCGNENPNPRATPIRIQEVSVDDGVTPQGGAVQILDRDEADGPLVEAPSMAAIKSDQALGGWMYVLFFSSNCYLTSLYDVSYATSVNGILNGFGGGGGSNQTSGSALVGGSKLANGSAPANGSELVKGGAKANASAQTNESNQTDGCSQVKEIGSGTADAKTNTTAAAIPNANYQKASTPLLTSTDGKGLLGPGGLDVDIDGTHVLFHSAMVADDPGSRKLHYGTVTTNGRLVSI